MNAEDINNTAMIMLARNGDITMEEISDMTGAHHIVNNYIMDIINDGVAGKVTPESIKLCTYKLMAIADLIKTMNGLTDREIFDNHII